MPGVKTVALVVLIAFVGQLLVSGPVEAGSVARVKELNLVFLHGAGGDAGSLQLLKDAVEELLPDYIANYERANPQVTVSYAALIRNYPNDVDIARWAANIGTSLDKHFRNKKDLILIGHSMGGKAALYGVAHNVNGMADKVAMVATINSPIRSLDRYSPAGGLSLDDYFRAANLLREDNGVIDSVLHYDSSSDGKLVGAQKYWLAFVSGEGAPSSAQFDYGSIDPAPRDMDDEIIPISAQYSTGADAVYYGERMHSSVGTSEEVAKFIADTILRYIFGGDIGFLTFAASGFFGHKADVLPGSDRWVDVVDEIIVGSGQLRHTNTSFSRWQQWEDVVGGYPPLSANRSSFQDRLTNVPVVGILFRRITEGGWLDPDNTADGRLVIMSQGRAGGAL